MASDLHDSMDNLWFYQNALFFKPNVSGTQSMLSRAESSRSKAQIKQPPAYKTKRPGRLNIEIGQPFFQLQPLQRSKPGSQSSTPSVNKNPHPKTRRISDKVRSYRSLTQLENDELKGFTDLGFTFPEDKLTPRMMSMLPGLERIGKKIDGVDERRRPCLSEAWLVSRPDYSKLHNLRMLPKTRDGEDVKENLKFWARRVAMLVHEGPWETLQAGEQRSNARFVDIKPPK